MLNREVAMSGDEKGRNSAVHGQSRRCSYRHCEVIIENPAPTQKYCSPFCKDSEWVCVRNDGKKVPKKGRQHFASINSPKLQRMLEFLSDGKVHTQIEIITATMDTSFNQTIQALRHHGFDIPAKFRKVTDRGGKVFDYQLILEV
jgi:hypothetical protein